MIYEQIVREDEEGNVVIYVVVDLPGDDEIQVRVAQA